MKLKLTLSIITVLFFQSLAFPGSKPVTLEWEGPSRVYMTEGIYAHVITFAGSQNDLETGMLPVFVDFFPLQKGKMVTNVSLSDIVYQPVAEEIITLLEDRDLIGNEIKVKSETVFIRKEPHARISFMPIRFNQETSSWEKIVSCTLEWVITEDLTHFMTENMRDFEDESVLANGTWYRFGVTQTGIHKIDYTELQMMGISTENLDPENIRIYGNGNGMVPESNAQSRYDDLNENAIMVIGEEDGSFDPEDYILFYGMSPAIWKYNYFTGLFEHQVNFYTEETYYFLTTDAGPGKRIVQDSLVMQDPTVVVDAFTDYQVHEEENISILKTGKIWWGEHYKSQLTYDYQFNFPNIIQESKVSLRTNIAARSTQNSFFDYAYNGSSILNAQIGKINLTSTVYAYSTTPDTVGFYPAGDDIVISVTYDPTSVVAEGWLNYIELNARRKLEMAGGQLLFRDHKNSGSGKIAGFRVGNASQDLKVWDVTDRFNVKVMHGSLEGDEYVFKAAVDELREFAAFDGTEYHSVSFTGEVPNQNLHAMDPVQYIIVSPPEFYDQAVRLGDLHQQYDQLSYLVVTPQQIYNEFSSGAQDIGAIRDFCRMLYQRSDSSNMPEYLLLFGDGSYDPKNRKVQTENWIPTFQSMESLKYGYSYVTEDFFCLYDNNEGNNAFGKTIDVGIGRFPVNTPEEAKMVVDKIQHYMENQAPVMGDWKNLICFIADDEDNNIHLKQAERLQAIIDTGYISFNVDKIYIDAYQQLNTPNGQRYPEVNQAITRAVEKGALIINYTGHGGENGWAHESILDIPTINSWGNYNMLPLFVTATCEFSRFDDPAIVSAGEWVLLNPNGGGIGLFTTTRLAWSDPNFKLNREIYKIAFEREDGQYPRLGDLVRISKTVMNTSQNIKNFVLLGDPALRLAYPHYNVNTTSINAREITGENDTIHALSKVTVEGEIVDLDGNLLNDFNGIVYPKVYDKKRKYHTIGNDPSSQVASFNLLDRMLFQGRSTVQEGKFSFTFMVPKDISYEYGYGKVSYFAYDTLNFRDANGFSLLTIGGTEEAPAVDLAGPEIEIFVDDLGFQPGDIVDKDPSLMIYIRDENGINTTGNGLGHDMIGILNEDYRQPLELNPGFVPDLDSYNSGWVYYPLNNLSDGTYTLSVKAWDIMNNPSEESTYFVVNRFGDLDILSIYNAPNPFREQTRFYFVHNKSNTSFEIEIEIYNLHGQLVRTLSQTTPSSGSTIEPMVWDGTDRSGNKLGSGLFFYRMKILDDQGNFEEYTKKLILSR